MRHFKSDHYTPYDSSLGPDENSPTCKSSHVIEATSQDHNTHGSGTKKQKSFITVSNTVRLTMSARWEGLEVQTNK